MISVVAKVPRMILVDMVDFRSNDLFVLVFPTGLPNRQFDIRVVSVHLLSEKPQIVASVKPSTLTEVQASQGYCST